MTPALALTLSLTPALTLALPRHVKGGKPLPISPYISPVSPQARQGRQAAPYISLYLPTSPLYLPRHVKGGKPLNFEDLWKYTIATNSWAEVGLGLGLRLGLGLGLGCHPHLTPTPTLTLTLTLTTTLTTTLTQPTLSQP